MTMKQGSNRGLKVGLAAGLVLLLFAASFVQPALNDARARMGLTQVTPLENAPPVLAFTTVALGGFRGIIANALWIRSNELEEKGKYFEAMQLADWITKLQPRLVQVWTVQAWNMAYNISVKFTSPEDKWRWVKAGTELLRDEGLRYNPDEALLYRELAWFFQHKIGHYLDSAHMYYKLQWAKAMLPLLGKERPNWDELLDPQTDEARERVRQLREVYKMDPAIMRQVDEEFGPLEWKLPETHAIYWATVGLQHAAEKDKDTLRRVIYQCMDVAFQRGRLILFYNDQGEATELFPLPNLDIIDKSDAAFNEMMRIDKERPRQSVGYQSFLRKVVYNLYSHARTGEAEKWWRKMKEIYPEAVRPGISLDEWCVEMVSEDASGKDQNKAMAAIEAQLTLAFYHLAIGEQDPAQTSIALAVGIWTRYMTEAGCLQDPPAADCTRIALPPLEAMRNVIRDGMLDPEIGISAAARARLLTALELPADYVPKAHKGQLRSPANETNGTAAEESAPDSQP